MRRVLPFFVVLLLLLSLRAESWTPKTYQLVVVQSMKVMPFSYRNLMYQHKEEMLAGSLNPDKLGESEHRYDVNARSGYLVDRITELAESIPGKIYAHTSFAEIAFDFGSLAHYLSDLNDPLLLEDNDPRETAYHDDFAAYLEKNIPLFPWIFGGHENILLKKDQVKDYVFETASRSARDYPLIGDAYYPDGALVSSNTFDAKSLPFGIANLSYNHSIENTVQIWFHVWRKSHGDTTYTPFYNEPKKKRGSR